MRRGGFISLVVCHDIDHNMNVKWQSDYAERCIVFYARKGEAEEVTVAHHRVLR